MDEAIEALFGLKNLPTARKEMRDEKEDKRFLLCTIVLVGRIQLIY